MKYLIILFSILLFASCNKKQIAMKDPLAGCDCAKEVSAKFYIEEMTTSNPNFVKYTDTDTIFANKNVRFRADADAAEYTWYIGAEVLNTQSFDRYFSPTLVGQTISVKLVLKKKANTICFPNDDGIDSITRTFFIAPAYDSYVFFNNPQPRFEGTYRMKEMDMNDSIDIIIDAVPFYPPANIEKVVMINYNGLGDTIIFSIYGTNYRQLFFNGSNYGFDSFWHYRLDGTYKIQLNPGAELEVPPFNIPSFYYSGRKLN